MTGTSPVCHGVRMRPHGHRWSALLSHRPHFAPILWAVLGVVLQAPHSSHAGWGGPLTVEVAPVREELVNASLYLTGDLESVRVATLSVEEEGRVVAVHIGEGDKVETGEVLVELDTTLLRLRVERDAARASGRQAELARDRVDYESQRALFEEGIIGHTVLAEVEGDFRVAGANVAEASAELALSREALNKGIPSPRPSTYSAKM